MFYVLGEIRKLIDPDSDYSPQCWSDNRSVVIIRIDGTNLLLMIRKMRFSGAHFNYIFHCTGS